MKELINLYELKKNLIKTRLDEFKNLKKAEYVKEFMFCLLTPQSNAQRCWEAVGILTKNDYQDADEITLVLKTRTRFHNNKSKYIIEGLKEWDSIKDKLNNPDKVELRNWLANNVKGYGLKEAGHFLRNIGKSDNQIAILDRHILRNLKALKVIEEEKLKGKNHYLKVERKFLEFSKKVNIPIDELDILFWSNENGEIFK